MTQKIKAGIIGCGKVGPFHAAAYQKIEDCELCAVFDVQETRAEAFAKKYGARAYTSIEAMVKENGLDVVSVCTPHPVHRQAAVEALKAGANIAIEKPLASSLEDCDAILQAAEENHALGTAICQRRFFPPSLRIRKAIDEGKIGKPVLGTVNMYGWRDAAYYASDPWRGTWKGEGGGVLVNQAPHQLDLLLWYMGEIDELYGMWDTLNHPGLEVEDTALAVIRFKNGGLGNIVVSNSQNPALYGKVHVHGSNGASIGVQTDGGAMFIAGVSSITEAPYNDLWTVAGEENLKDQWKAEDEAYFQTIDATTHFHYVQLSDFIDALRTGRRPLISLEDARQTVELFTAIYRSQRDKKPVRFPLEPEYGKDFDGRLNS